MRKGWLVAWTCAVIGVPLFAPEGAPALDRLAEPGRLLVGIDEAFPPFEYLEDGRPAGFDVELMRAIAATIGYELRIEAGPWHEIRSRLEAGTIDLTPAMVWSPERDEVLDFSIPVAVANYTAFVPDGSAARVPADLLGQRVLVQKSGYLHDLLRTLSLDVEVVTADSPLDALRRLAAGEAAGALLLDAQGLYLMREHGLGGLHSLGSPVRTVYYRMAVAEGRSDLLALLNDGLTELRISGAYDRLFDAWFGVLKEPPALLRRLLFGLAAVSAVALAGLALSALWSFVLRRRVAAAVREQRRLERRLHHAQKMEALGRLAGSVAHDFGNLLTVILGNAALLRAQPSGTAASDALLAEVEQAGTAAADLTQQLLSFARGRGGAPRRLTWAQVIGEKEAMLRRLAPREIAIEIRASGAGWPFAMDPVQASQLLMNLFVNAVDATQGRGVVELRTSDEEIAGRQWACLTIRDHGVGMDEATRERIFEPFFTTKEPRGTGLGLATVHAIVRQAEGEVDVESAPGAGSSFRVRIPRAPDGPARPSRPGSLPQEPLP